MDVKSEMPKIYGAIHAVMESIGAIGKDDVNKSQGFKYRGIDAVYNALSPALIKHKVFVVPEVLEQIREERQSAQNKALIYSICKVRYTFYAEDGSSVQAVVIGEGMDSGDKATNKAMSVAFKYACFQVFCIPTEEMMDPDAESPEVKPKGKNSSPKITKEMFSHIRAEMERTGVYDTIVCDSVGVERLEDMTVAQYKEVIRKFKNTASRVDPVAVAAMAEDDDLPFN